MRNNPMDDPRFAKLVEMVKTAESDPTALNDLKNDVLTQLVLMSMFSQLITMIVALNDERNDLLLKLIGMIHKADDSECMNAQLELIRNTMTGARQAMDHFNLTHEAECKARRGDK